MLRHNQSHFDLHRFLYEFLSKEASDEVQSVLSKVKRAFSGKKRQFGEIFENILSIAATLDIVAKGQEESPLLLALTYVIPFAFKYYRKEVHIVPTIKYLCIHLESSLLSLYVPILENSVITLMNFDEIKTFSFLPEMSVHELKLFWELYSHGQFIYNKIDKTVKVVFNLCDEMPDIKKSIIYKAVCDLCKECQPDLPLVEVGERGIVLSHRF